MNLVEYIWLRLVSLECTFFSQRNEYYKDKNWLIDFQKWRIAWKSEKIANISNLVSQAMRETFEELDQKALFINCAEKNEDILLHILRLFLAKLDFEATDIIKYIGKYSIITDNESNRYDLVVDKNSTEILDIYQKSLLERINEMPEKADMIMRFEYDNTIHTLAKLLYKAWLDYIYIFLDRIDNLTIDEQQRINQILYSRWWISKNKYLRLKINNIWNYRKIWKSISWISIQSTHDFQEIRLEEGD